MTTLIIGFGCLIFALLLALGFSWWMLDEAVNELIEQERER